VLCGQGTLVLIFIYFLIFLPLFKTADVRERRDVFFLGLVFNYKREEASVAIV